MNHYRKYGKRHAQNFVLINSLHTKPYPSTNFCLCSYYIGFVEKSKLQMVKKRYKNC